MLSLRSVHRDADAFRSGCFASPFCIVSSVQREGALPWPWSRAVLHRGRQQCSSHLQGEVRLHAEVFCSISSPCLLVQSKLEAFCSVNLKDRFVVLVRLYSDFGGCLNLILLRFYCVLLNCFCFIVNETKSSLQNSLRSKIIQEQR